MPYYAGSEPSIASSWQDDYAAALRHGIGVMVDLPHFNPHQQRETVLREVHARPFRARTTPTRALHFAFMTGADDAVADRAAFETFCRRNDVDPPPPGAKQHRVTLPAVEVGWEQHSEFTSYTFTMAAAAPAPFTPPAATLMAVLPTMEFPGHHLVSADLHLVADDQVTALGDHFDASSLTACSAAYGAAAVATDFRADSSGFVRLLVIDRGLTPARAGALIQRILEIETYRTLALLGLPEAHRLAPLTAEVEANLGRIAQEMTRADDLDYDHALLNELTTLASRLEADTTASSYRFSASRAYAGIVDQRLDAIHEAPLETWPTLSSFLARRMKPAMRTCEMLVQRQEALSEKLARTANLLRTRVNVAIEGQNRDLLKTMNERTHLQLRLQQTVEGLSVAAISYYVVGLLSYVFKGLKDYGIGPDATLMTALSVPVAVAGVALVVRRIRRVHGADPRLP